MGGIWRHRLSAVDQVAKTATCTLCGPNTRVRLRKGKNGADRWVCNSKESIRHRKSQEKYVDRWSKARLEYIKAQDGRCAICGRKRTLVLDHCHRTGIKRAALCYPCNLAIGLFCDEPELMRKAAEYIEKFRK